MEVNNSKIIFIDITSFNTQDDCNMIINTMKQFYNTKTCFKLILETKDLTVDKISLQSVYQLSVSLNSFKKHKIQYLKKTTINIYSIYCYELLYFLFTYLSDPLAQVEVILYNTSNIEKIQLFFPKKLN